jgi:hypothetical protein
VGSVAGDQSGRAVAGSLAKSPGSDKYSTQQQPLESSQCERALVFVLLHFFLPSFDGRH